MLIPQVWRGAWEFLTSSKVVLGHWGSSSKGDYTVFDVGLVSSSLETYAVLLSYLFLSFGLDVKSSRDRRGSSKMSGP